MVQTSGFSLEVVESEVAMNRALSPQRLSHHEYEKNQKSCNFQGVALRHQTHGA